MKVLIQYDNVYGKYLVSLFIDDMLIAVLSLENAKKFCANLYSQLNVIEANQKMEEWSKG